MAARGRLDRYEQRRREESESSGAHTRVLNAQARRGCGLATRHLRHESARKAARAGGPIHRARGYVPIRPAALELGPVWYGARTHVVCVRDLDRGAGESVPPSLEVSLKPRRVPFSSTRRQSIENARRPAVICVARQTVRASSRPAASVEAHPPTTTGVPQSRTSPFARGARLPTTVSAQSWGDELEELPDTRGGIPP